MSASNSSISILLPVHNDSSYLVRAVTSMRRQTFQDWELLLLDDGYEDLPARFDGCMLLAAVGSWGVRDVIRRRLESLGYREPEEFLCVA